jgi:poly-gamma-glutamate synthesis protein (capsule biosynthesis protein)
LPLVIDGWDPLRDPANESPLAGARWIDAGTPSANRDWAELLGWQEPSELNPLGYVATGDFIPVRCVGRAVRSVAEGDFGQIFALVGPHLRSADVLAVSMEVSATDLGAATPCIDRLVQLVLQADPAVLDALAEAGVDLVTTAGNHAGDCNTFCPWRDALVDTVSELEARGLAHAGTGSTLAEARAPALVERDGVRLAILSYDAIAPWFWALETGPGTAPAIADVVAEDVAAARLLADHVIVALSWGEEYVLTTTSGQEAIVDAALDAGASLIVGNHPHTVQPLVERKLERADALVAYALGNFVFDQSWSPQTTQSVLLEVGFSRERLIGYRVRPVVIRRDFQPELVSPRGTEGAQTLDRLWRATDQWLSIHDELR